MKRFVVLAVLICAVVPSLMAAGQQPAASGMRVAVDPATGQIRALTPEESRAFAAEVAKLAAPQKPLRIQATSSGMQFIALDESYFHFYVARTGEDGQVVLNCVDSAPDAAAALSPVIDSVLRLPSKTRGVVLEDK